MTPEQFIEKWQAADLKERAAAQSHVNDLCELPGDDKPTDLDPLVHRSRQKIHLSMAAHAMLPRFQPCQGADGVNLLNASVHEGAWYCFERGLTKATGGDGRAPKSRDRQVRAVLCEVRLGARPSG